GTEMGAALEAAIQALTQSADEPERNRAIILVTDGAVQPDEIEQAEDAAIEYGIRLFVVAVGSSAGADVLAPLALATQAALERAVPAEPIDEAVMRQVRRAHAGAPIDIHIDWGTPDALPLPLNHAWAGDAITAWAMLPAGGPLQASVTLDGARHQQTFRAANAVEAPALRALVGHTAYQYAADEDKAALALHYGLITEQTAAVLVKLRDDTDKAEGLPTVTPVRHMQPAGMLMEHVDACLRSYPDDECDYMDIPAFMRRAVDSSVAMDSEADEVAHAVLQALVELLLDEQATAIATQDLLNRIDPALHLATTEYLTRTCPQGLDMPAAIQLLQQLLTDVDDDFLADDQRARLRMIASHATCQG
ncbi:MAG: VWA domain-containing protein, partial [Xanthomonadales bacterium]|nr:VWA domain-containing protein [Xanthomonadales bacterium]